jgi:CIC family chloride channel protein
LSFPFGARLRQIPDLWRDSEMTRGIILIILIGLASGLGAVLFRWMVSGFTTLFFDGGETAFGFLGKYYVIILPALGGLVVGLLVYFLAREAKGHGVPEVMLAVNTHGGRIRSRVAAVKALASAICIGSGGSAGREGPIVQIGASVGSTIGQWFRLPEDWVKLLVACGAAGGISATFNAPIAGIFFALELILRRFTPRNFILVGLSSIIAAAISFVFWGNTPTFTMIPEYTWSSGWELPLYILLGVVAALIAKGFITALYRSEDLFKAWHFPDYLKPIIGGFAVGLIGFFYPQIFGVGYEGIEVAILGGFGVGLLIVLCLLKIVATSFTIGSGGSGGVFAPSLFIGAMLGTAFGMGANTLFPTVVTEPGAFGLVGMGAVFAAAAHAPITAILILFEMTRDYPIILPLMLAVITSTQIARRLSPDSIYTLKLRRKGVKIIEGELDPLQFVTVGEVMTSDFPTISTEMPIIELSRKLKKSGHHGFPVTDEEGRFYGMVTVSDVEQGLKEEQADLKVSDIATRNPITTYPDQSVHDILSRLGTVDVGRIPVVARDDPLRLLGVLRRHDIIRAYNKAAEKAKRSGLA